jgi:vacuolar protein sorting-associated protein 26
VDDGTALRQHIYLDGEPITGKIAVALRKPGSKLEHLGLKVELIGQIELHAEKTSPYRFTYASTDIVEPGELIRNTTFDFELDHIKKPYETYRGANVTVRYFLRVSILRRMNGTIVADLDIVIHVPSQLPEVTRNVKTEVGIGDTLHIELECNKWKYHLSDVISGSINFLLVSTEIASVQLQILQRETAGIGAAAVTENQIVASFEILDGTPKTGDSMPIRLFLSSYSLSPTMRNIEERFTVKYYLNLVIVDDVGNKYFKQQEVTLYRRDEKAVRTAAVNSAACTWKKLKKSAPIQVKHTSVKVTFQNEPSNEPPST